MCRSAALLQTCWTLSTSASNARTGTGDEVRTSGDPPLEFVGSLDTSVDVSFAGGHLRDALGFGVAQRRGLGTWSEALRQFIEQAEVLGILVMVSGIVGSNTHRSLDPEEFRGFVLSDPLAPLVFLNGADTKAAQMFTLAHEISHLWLGASGISNSQAVSTPDNAGERWCNQVAAELLAPAEIVSNEFDPNARVEHGGRPASPPVQGQHAGDSAAHPRRRWAESR